MIKCHRLGACAAGRLLTKSPVGRLEGRALQELHQGGKLGEGPRRFSASGGTSKRNSRAVRLSAPISTRDGHIYPVGHQSIVQALARSVEAHMVFEQNNQWSNLLCRLM
jgi:hypothetical protein